MNKRLTRNASPVREVRFEVSFLEPERDDPTLSILIDGRPVFDRLGRSGYIGFNPDEMFLEDGALVPREQPRRVAVYSCNCGEPGCGVVAPVVWGDANFVRWSDFRDFTGVFAGPTIDADTERRYAGSSRGGALPLEELIFDRGQYESELRRATLDRSWESPERRTARLVRQALLAEPDRFGEQGVEFGWFNFMYWRPGPPRWFFETHSAGESGGQYLAEIETPAGSAEEQAQAILSRLREVPVLGWPEAFPRSDPGHS